MAFDQKIKDRLSWGDTVLVSQNAPNNFYPGRTGSICGERIVEDFMTSHEFNAEKGTRLLLIEFEDGTSIEIPEKYICLKS